MKNGKYIVHNMLKKNNWLLGRCTILNSWLRLLPTIRFPYIFFKYFVLNIQSLLTILHEVVNVLFFCF